MFVSIDLLGPEGMILSFAQQMSKNLVNPDKIFTDICHVGWNEKKGAKIFSLERLPFLSKLCVFNHLSDLGKMLLKIL